MSRARQDLRMSSRQSLPSRQKLRSLTGSRDVIGSASEETMTATILVTGATGTVGSELIKQLLARGERIRAGMRHPVPGDGSAEIVALDYERPEIGRASW